MDDKTEIYRGGTYGERALLISLLGGSGIPCFDTKLGSAQGPASLYVHPNHAAEARQLLRAYDRPHGGKVISPEQYRRFQRMFVICLLLCILAIAYLMHQVHLF